jgi:Uma2 family endonuclease
MEPPRSTDHHSHPAADERPEDAATGGADMATPLRTRRFTVDEYYRMADAGILGAHERVELIEGEIIRMEAIGSRHAATVTRLDRLFQTLGGAALVWVQNPVRLSDLSEPEPDVALLQPKSDDYASAHPGPADTLLIVEVSDTTVGFDRGIKAPLYAVSGIREYWLVDIAAETIEVYREPGAAGYRDVTTHRRGEVLHPLAFADFDVPVDAILR